MLGQLEKCLQILLDSNRIPEAAFFARTYLPSEISRIVELWREQLSKVNEKAGQSLADPKVKSNYLFLRNNFILLGLPQPVPRLSGKSPGSGGPDPREKQSNSCLRFPGNTGKNFLKKLFFIFQR